MAEDFGPIVAYFSRHGETANNAAGRFRGQSNVPLDENGLKDAERMGEFFKPIPLSAVFSTSRDRTVVTARAVADPKSLKVTPIKELDPLNVGYLAGEKKDDHPDVMNYFQEHPNSKIPMGDSINSFRQRTQPAIKKILKMGMQSKNPPLAVVHSSIIHEVNHMLTGDHTQTLVKPGGIVAVHYHPQKGFKIKALLHPSTGAGDSKYGG